MKNVKILILLISLLNGSAYAKDKLSDIPVTTGGAEPFHIEVHVDLSSGKVLFLGNCHVIPIGNIPSGTVLTNVRVSEDIGWTQSADGTGFFTSRISGDYLENGNFKAEATISCTNSSHPIRAEDYTSNLGRNIDVTFLKK